jgi:EF hand
MFMRKNAKFTAGAWLAAMCLTGLATAADAPPTTSKLEVGLSPTIRLLQLMDTDKNGKVSKEEFMRFMEAEFEFADKNKDGELDPQELQHLVRALEHPSSQRAKEGK